MQYHIYLDCYGELKIHKAGCSHIKKDKTRETPMEDIWMQEADSVTEAIALDRQELFESAGGKGDFKTADPIEWEDAIGYARQTYNIIDCAR